MSDRLKLLLLDNRDIASLVFTEFAKTLDGMEALGITTEGEMPLGRMFQDIASGRVSLWMGYYDGEYIGFAVTSIDREPQGQSMFHIRAVYIKKGADRSILLDALGILEQTAAKYACSHMRLWTKREKGMGRVLEPKGYKKTSIEFTKEVSR